MGNMFFKDMDSEPPLKVAEDNCGSEVTAGPYLDACGLGVKRTPEAYMFGFPTSSLTGAAMCNGIILGSGTTVGTARNTSKYYLYLDTDGTATGGCAAVNDAGVVGFEFQFKYVVEFNSQTNKVAETLTAQKCSSGSWIASSVPFKSDRMKGCGFVTGPIFGIDKDSLTAQASVNTTKSWRAYGATADSGGNNSVVNDTVGPGYADFQGIDIELVDCTNIEDADNPQCTKFQQFGFFPGEFGPACTDSIDNDGDGSTDCNDFDCKYDPFFCSASGFTSQSGDTNSPQIVWSKVNNKIPTSLTWIFDTNEPSNGTIKFYNNDSKCSSLNATIYDQAVGDGRDITNFRPHHVAGKTGLQANKTYYFKYHTCDPTSNCGFSKCSNATTAEKHSNITFKLAIPSNCTIDMPSINLSNYSRGFAIKALTEHLNNINVTVNCRDNTSRLTFIGIDIFEKQILNMSDFFNTANLLGIDANQYGSFKQKTGLDEVIVEIPTTGDTLSHCDDDGANCKEVTSNVNCTFSTGLTKCTIADAVGLGFSTYKTSTASSSSSSSSSSSGGGGGGGGGGAVAPKPKAVSLLEDATFNAGGEISVETSQGTVFTFSIVGIQHTLTVSKLYANKIIITIFSEPVTTSVMIGETKHLDVDSDGVADILVRVDTIIGGTIKMTLQKLNLSTGVEEATVEAVEPVQEVPAAPEPTPEPTPEEVEESDNVIITILVVLLVFFIIVLITLKAKGRRN